MDQKLKSECLDLYQLQNGIYHRSSRVGNDTQLKLALQKNHVLSYVKCHQLLHSQNSSAKQINQTVYHPARVLSPRTVLIQKQPQNQQINSCRKSILTAETQRKNSLSSLSQIENFTSIQTQTLSNLLQTPLKTNLYQNYDLENSQNSKSQSLKSSRFMRISTSKANKSEIKMMDIPLGYEISESNSIINSKKSINDAIELPEPQQKKEKIHYVKKLVTLFELKNSESQDDLHSFFSGLCKELSNSKPNIKSLNQAEQKILQESELKKQNKKLSPFVSNSLIEESEKCLNLRQNIICKNGSDNKSSKYQQKSNLYQRMFSFQIQEDCEKQRSFSKNEEQLKNKADESIRSKQIRGLKKVGRIKQKSLIQGNEKKLSTPKFGTGTIFN